MGSATDHFNIRWNNYTVVLQSVFKKLLDGEQFVDVTLACEGKSIKCHRVVLSACSTYFEKLLTENSFPHLVIFIKDMKYWELQALVTFMYNGEVSVNQNKLANLVKAAESLKIKGLAPESSFQDNEQDKIDEDDIEEYHFGTKKENFEREENQSLLRISSTPKQLKRKVLAAPPKLVKMQKIERQFNGGATHGPPKIEGPQTDQHSDEDHTFSGENSGIMEHHDKDEDAEEDIESLEVNVMTVDEGSRDEHSSHSDVEENQGNVGGVVRSRFSYKYDKEIRDSALAALSSGMSLRQCSEAFGIPRKTLSKWKNRTPTTEENGEGEEEGVQVVRRPNATAGTAQDGGDRAERLQKAMELAVSGVTVRQAAAHFDIPRTTLCAYMKRRGVAPKRNFLAATGSRNTRNVQLQNVAQYDDFPFLGLSEMMDELEQGYNPESQK